MACSVALRRQGGGFWHIYSLFRFERGPAAVHLPALAAQLPTLAAMFVVCAFGSCLDVAAIQADMEAPIDFNAELTTAGGCAAADEHRVARNHCFMTMGSVMKKCHPTSCDR